MSSSSAPFADRPRPIVRVFVGLALAVVGWAAGTILSPRDQVRLQHDGRTHTIRVSALEQLSLVDVRTGAPAPVRSKRGTRLYIVLSASDCSSCLQETDHWNLLNVQAADRLEIVGIIVNSSLSEARDYTAGFAPTFPVYVAADALGPTWAPLEGMTPVKILVDDDHRPLLAEVGGTPSSTFGQRVLKAITARGD